MSTTPEPQKHGVMIAGRYVIGRKLGSGSMGTVYQASDRARSRPVALKIIRVERLLAGAVTRIQREFQAFASLRHPQIARAYDFGYTDDSRIPFYTREYIEGSPLPPGPPGRDSSPSQYLKPILDLLDAVGYLHDHGMLHLDIHAGNLLVADDRKRGSVLIDFGVVPSIDAPRFSVAEGNLTALPPEMLKRGDLTARSDVFLVGRLLHYRLTGQTEGEVRLPREIPGWGSRLTLDLERIISKALQAAAERRFGSAQEFLEALSGALGETRTRTGGWSPHDVILGRNRELQAIEDALRGLPAGAPAVLWLAGRNGLGKTRLLKETRQRAQLRGLHVVTVEFAADSARGPVLLEALRSAGLVAKRGRSPHSWLEPIEVKHGGTPEERARRAAEAYFAESGEPLVLLLDDFDRADRDSRSLAEALVAECLRHMERGSRGRGLAILLAGALGARSGVDKRLFYELRPLPGNDCRRLLRILLKPLVASDQLVRQAVARSEGVPLYLRQLAMALKTDWGKSGVIPPDAQLPLVVLPISPARPGARAACSHGETAVLEALAVLDRPARTKELAAALGGKTADLARHLRRLVRLEIVWASGRGSSRRYRLNGAEAAGSIASGVAPDEVRRIHRRVADAFRGEKHPTPLDLENLVGHLLVLGELEAAQRLAFEAARQLRRSGSFDRAVRLLEKVAEREETPRKRLELAEEMSTIYGENGDHQRGIAIMEPFFRDAAGGLTTGEWVRASRRLGVHYHRAGAVEQALSVFEKTREKANPQRDLEDLIFIDSELGELHIFLGRYADAEEACRRGLERLGELAPSDAFRCRMEVVLRASMGHLKLRRLALDSARKELLAASRLAARYGTTAEQASILNNLGIAANQLNEFARARQYFERAERLLLKAGERRSIIEVANNLAFIAAKQGDRDEAHLHLERAARMVERYPGKRIEFFTAYARGIVHQLLGEVRDSVRALEPALALGRELGDSFLVRFGEVYLAEAYLVAGRYAASWKQLRATAKRAEREGPPLLVRMIHSRLCLVEALLGRQRPAARSRRVLSDTERTDVVLVEAWNDALICLADILSGLSGAAAAVPLDGPLEVFSRLDVPFGERFVRLAAFIEALKMGDQDLIRARLEDVEARPDCGHALLAVAEPLARAEAHFVLDDLDGAENWLGIASGAIVGSPFLELDWRIELLRARIALKRRSSRDARRHLHRAYHTRDLLLELVPPQAREKFLAHPRFALLREGALPAPRSPRLQFSTERLRRTARYEGMVGHSSAMIRVFRLIEELRDHEVPVLIAGDTGTGKEMVARAIHHRSSRRQGPFQALHCASLPEHLFESELFGYEAGAFTGAEQDQPGLLESLDGGTLLFDEISELAIGLQSKLLEVLDSGYIRRLGSVVRRRLDVRFLVSTSRDLSAEVTSGRMRPDLYYRLRGVEITLPPLKERKEDIAYLAKFLAARHAAQLERPVPDFAADALELLATHDWPGNVREMETILLRSLVNLSGAATIRARDVAPFLGQRPVPRLFDPQLLESHPLQDLKLQLEREYLVDLFFRARGNAKRMMSELGVKRTQLYAWFQRLGVDVRELRRKL